MDLIKMTDSTRLSDYLPVPRCLLSMDLSSTAILLYGLLLDRSSLSRKNGYSDYGGWIYVVYAREDLARQLGISVRMTSTCLQALESKGLIRRIRRSRKEGNRYFLYVPQSSVSGTDTGTDMGSLFPGRQKKTSSGTGRKLHPNHLSKPQEKTSIYIHNQEESL